MLTTELTINTTERKLVDLTANVRDFCAGQGDGLLSVFAPHSTVGLALVHPDQGVDADLLAAIGRLIPRAIAYEHTQKSPGHGADHVLPALVSPSLVIPVIAGCPALGEFQHLVLVDLDTDTFVRTVRLTLLTDSRHE